MMYGVADTASLHFATAANKIGNGLDEQLENFIKEHPDTKLVIIDTMQKIREAGGEAYSYASDYEIIGKLKRFADRHSICIVTVHHTRKQPAGDSFETISGTTGLLGCADGALLTVTQFKVQQEQARLESIEDKIDRRKQTLEKYNEKIREQKGAAASFHEIDSIGKKTISGNISMTPQDAQFLKELAKEGIASRGLIGDLKNKVETLKRDVSVWKRKYEKLQEQTKDFMAALKRAPRKVKEFIVNPILRKYSMSGRMSKKYFP